MRVNDKRIGKRRKREAKRGWMKQSIKANEGTRKENDESKVKVAVRRAKNAKENNDEGQAAGDHQDRDTDRE